MKFNWSSFLFKHCFTLRPTVIKCFLTHIMSASKHNLFHRIWSSSTAGISTSPQRSRETCKHPGPFSWTVNPPIKIKAKHHPNVSWERCMKEFFMNTYWCLSVFGSARFDIMLMREGRMKGQAFVGLPSERSAEKALKETNGYVLHDKPLVVVSFVFGLFWHGVASGIEDSEIHKSKLALAFFIISYNTF